MQTAKSILENVLFTNFEMSFRIISNRLAPSKNLRKPACILKVPTRVNCDLAA